MCYYSSKPKAYGSHQLFINYRCKLGIIQDQLEMCDGSPVMLLYYITLSRTLSISRRRLFIYKI